MALVSGSIGVSLSDMISFARTLRVLHDEYPAARSRPDKGATDVSKAVCAVLSGDRLVGWRVEEWHSRLSESVLWEVRPTWPGGARGCPDTEPTAAWSEGCDQRQSFKDSWPQIQFLKISWFIKIASYKLLLSFDFIALFFAKPMNPRHIRCLPQPSHARSLHNMSPSPWVDPWETRCFPIAIATNHESSFGRVTTAILNHDLPLPTIVFQWAIKKPYDKSLI